MKTIIIDTEKTERHSTQERSAPFTRGYTRAQAIEEGVLINLTDFFPECPRLYRQYPVACSAGVWEVISQGVNNPRCREDFRSVVSDFLNISASIAHLLNSKEYLFPFTMTGYGEDKQYALRAICGPGDCDVQVVTIMLQEE